MQGQQELVGMQNGAATLEDSWRFLTKLNILLQAAALLDINSKEVKTYVHKKTCTCMFTAALFIIAKTSVGEWINNCATTI